LQESLQEDFAGMNWEKYGSGRKLNDFTPWFVGLKSGENGSFAGIQKEQVWALLIAPKPVETRRIRRALFAGTDFAGMGWEKSGSGRK
jgi:hypothetical protein